jgi:N-acetylornithine carbamoyltransferase
MNHFLSTGQWTPDEFSSFLDFAADVKSGAVTDRLDGKTMGMLFFNSSLRTRTSFEVGMYQLGGHAVNLTVGSGMWNLEHEFGAIMDGDKAEHVKEAAGVLSRYVDVLGVRAFADANDWTVDRTDPVVGAFAEFSDVPLINMESAVWHPCQAIADAMTWREQGLSAGDPIVISWTWHPKALPMAVPNSALLAAAQYGLNVTLHRPDAYALCPSVMKEAQTAADAAGGSVTESDDLGVLDGAKVIYAKSWGSLAAYGNPAAEQTIRNELKAWQVTPDWMDRTDDGKFMHCLPVRRNVVVADEVIDSPSSIVLDQAENRLHGQKALLLDMLGDPR